MTQNNKNISRKNNRLVITCALGACLMLSASYAAVPLYQLFCQITGFGGTTQSANTVPDTVLNQAITIRFDANTSKDLGWDFKPAQNQIKLKIGENRLAFYEAVNTSDQEITGTATFNVTPFEAGTYFNKIQCFCFTEQSLKAGERVEMPVSFFIDPEITKDPQLKNVRTITLSYTFFPVKKEAELKNKNKPVRGIN